MWPDAAAVPVGAAVDEASSRLARWEAVLTDLEASAAKAHEGNAVPSPWAPPVGLGPLPPELADRALEVVAAQRAALKRVEDARTGVLGHLGALRSLDALREPRAAVYLDVEG